MITKIALFKNKRVRKTIYNNEWWFSVVDVLEALTDSTQPSKYWTAMKARVLYKLRGYPDDWIEKRMRGIVIREELTDEWKNRGAQGQRDYEMLTAEISKAAFGITPSEYKEVKGFEARKPSRSHG